MEVYYPSYYSRFSCLASACPDSCCKEWSVDVDADSAAFYSKLTGPLGDRLRQVLQNTDAGTVMAIENGRCPMWRQDGLCQIQAELGHDALCKVCREFPRLKHDYGTFAEYGLELSCPEAARLILAETGSDWIVETVSAAAQADYETEIIDTLRRSRAEFLDFMWSTSLSIPEILTVFLLYTFDVQEELDGGAPAVLDPEGCLAASTGFAKTRDYQALQDFFKDLEILTPQWNTRLATPAMQPAWNRQYLALLQYFVQRYWFQAVADYDIYCRAKFAVSACLLIGCLGGDLAQTAQLFSKEIENDPDNVDAIFDGAYTSPALTDAYLLGLLAK